MAGENMYYIDVTWAPWRPSHRRLDSLLNSLFGLITEKHQNSASSFLWGEAIVIPRKTVSNTEDVSMPWRHMDQRQDFHKQAEYHVRYKHPHTHSTWVYM